MADQDIVDKIGCQNLKDPMTKIINHQLFKYFSVVIIIGSCYPKQKQSDPEK